jgi:hypothetical protein
VPRAVDLLVELMRAGRQYEQQSRANGRSLVDPTIRQQGDEGRQWGREQPIPAQPMNG